MLDRDEVHPHGNVAGLLNDSHVKLMESSEVSHAERLLLLELEDIRSGVGKVEDVETRWIEKVSI